MNTLSLPGAIARVIDRGDLAGDEMQAVMHTIMTGGATPAQIGGFLVGLRMKGETVAEIAAAARVMRELATPVVVANRAHLVDTCGTGGDGARMFNVSTAAAFVAAAGGARVAKHGNRSISSRSGSADVLEAAGVRLDLTPEQVAACIDEVGVGFMFAPAHHGAMKHAIGPRREMAVRTVFNLLGPLTNPAGAPNQVLGVFDARWLEPMAEVLRELGSRHVLVVHSDDGLDEISVGATTEVAELRGGEIRRYRIEPEAFGCTRADIAQLAVDDAQQSLARIRAVFDGEPGAAADIVALNAGAALYVAGLADDHAAGVKRARELTANGAARECLGRLVAFSGAQ